MNRVVVARERKGKCEKRGHRTSQWPSSVVEGMLADLARQLYIVVPIIEKKPRTRSCGKCKLRDDSTEGMLHIATPFIHGEDHNAVGNTFQ